VAISWRIGPCCFCYQRGFAHMVNITAEKLNADRALIFKNVKFMNALCSIADQTFA